jgi:PAS domain S-box-containing protein
VLGKPLDQIVIPESRRAEHRNGLERFLATGHGPLLGQTVEVSALQRNGEEFPAEICVTPIEVGGTIHFSAFVRDIRERKKFIADLQESEARLRESERRFRQLAESVKEVFWICSVDGREIFYVSPAFEEIWQRPVEALYRRPLEWLTFVHPADRDQMEAALRNRNAEAEFDQTYRIMRPDGSVRWVRDRGFPVRDEQGRTFRFAGISEDITERRLVEEALENSEALYHSLVDHLPVNISRKDLQGRITFANRRVCETLGMPLEKLVGLTDFDLFPPDLAQKYQADDQRVIETGQTFECVEEHADPGQGRIYVQVLKAPVYDSQERIIGIQVIWWDVTDKKRAEDELRRTAEELARSNRELEQFAYVASHDLQEPLRMVASYVQLLERRYKGKLDADADDFIRFSVDGALRMQRLISDLLAYARVGSRGKPFQPVKLESVYAEATANLQAAIRAEKAKVTRDPLPTIPGDAGQLVQLLQNLIANGIKFHGAEPAQVHVSASHEGDHWRFTVRDNGIGIDPQYRDKIFGIFQRLHGKGEYAGTGIGLAICKKIVERHNGQIWVDSELGKGCAFCFTLPDAAE